MLVGTAASTLAGTTVATCVIKVEGTRAGTSLRTVVGIATGVTGPADATGVGATATGTCGALVVGTATGATDNGLGIRLTGKGVKTGGRSIPRGFAAEIAAGKFDTRPGKRLSNGFAASMAEGRL